MHVTITITRGAPRIPKPCRHVRKRQAQIDRMMAETIAASRAVSA